MQSELQGSEEEKKQGRGEGKLGITRDARLLVSCCITSGRGVLLGSHQTSPSAATSNQAPILSDRLQTGKGITEKVGVDVMHST